MPLCFKENDSSLKDLLIPMFTLNRQIAINYFISNPSIQNIGPTFSGILKSQIIRYDRICSDPYDLENACDILFCGYSKRYRRSIKNKTLQLQELKQKLQLKVGSIKPCRGKLCQTCNFIQETTQIKNGNETVKIFPNLNCTPEI